MPDSDDLCRKNARGQCLCVDCRVCVCGPCLAGSDAVQNKERIAGSGESKQELVSDVRSMNLLPASVNEETTDNAGFVFVVEMEDSNKAGRYQLASIDR